jgi:hypothetical protein
MVTLFVNAANIFSSYVLQFIPSPLDLSSLDPVNFSSSLLGSSFSTLVFANTLAGDGINTVFPIKERISFPLQAKHSYQNP